MFFVVAMIYDYDYQSSKARQSRQTGRQTVRDTVFLPGHTRSKHDWCWMESPLHSPPVGNSLGLMQERLRTRNPTPQVLEHGLHKLQAVNSWWPTPLALGTSPKRFKLFSELKWTPVYPTSMRARGVKPLRRFSANRIPFLPWDKNMVLPHLVVSFLYFGERSVESLPLAHVCVTISGALVSQATLPFIQS